MERMRLNHICKKKQNKTNPGQQTNLKLFLNTSYYCRLSAVFFIAVTFTKSQTF